MSEFSLRLLLWDTHYSIHTITGTRVAVFWYKKTGLSDAEGRGQHEHLILPTCQQRWQSGDIRAELVWVYECCIKTDFKKLTHLLFNIWNQVFTNFTGRMYPLLSVKPDCFFGFFLNMSHVLWAHLWSRQGLMSTALSRERGKGRERERERLVECFHEPHFRSSRLATSKNREQGRRSPGMFKKEFWGCEWDARSLQGHRASCVYSLIKNARIQTKTRRRQEHIN